MGKHHTIVKLGHSFKRGVYLTLWLKQSISIGFGVHRVSFVAGRLSHCHSCAPYCLDYTSSFLFLRQNQLSLASGGHTSVPTRASACQRHHWFSSLRPLEHPFNAPPICRKPLALISWCLCKSLNKQLFSDLISPIKTLNTQITLTNKEEVITHRFFFSDNTTKESQRSICSELDSQINLTAAEWRQNIIQGRQRVHCFYRRFYKSLQSPSVYYKCPVSNPHAAHTHFHNPPPPTHTQMLIYLNKNSGCSVPIHYSSLFTSLQQHAGWPEVTKTTEGSNKEQFKHLHVFNTSQ